MSAITAPAHTQLHTHGHWHILLPQLPLSCPLSWRVELCWQAPLLKVCVGGIKRRREGSRGRKVMEGWMPGEFGVGNMWRENRQRGERGNRTTQHEAKWNMSPCHLPHSVNGWPLQSCHQRLIPAAPKAAEEKKIKRAKRRETSKENGWGWFPLPLSHSHLLQFRKKNMTGWNYSATTEVVICKCHKVEV